MNNSCLCEQLYVTVTVSVYMYITTKKEYVLIWCMKT